MSHTEVKHITRGKATLIAWKQEECASKERGHTRRKQDGELEIRMMSPQRFALIK